MYVYMGLLIRHNLPDAPLTVPLNQLVQDQLEQGRQPEATLHGRFTLLFLEHHWVVEQR